MPTLQTIQFCSDVSTDVSSYFSSLPSNSSSMITLNNVNEMNLQFQSFDCVPEENAEPASKTLSNELPWSTAQPIGEPKPQQNYFMQVKVEEDEKQMSRSAKPQQNYFMQVKVEEDEKQMSRSAPPCNHYVPTFAVPVPKLEMPDLEIPSFRREVSFVGQDQGFDLFSPDGDWEDEKFPSVVEGEMKLPFQFDQRDQVPPTSNGLNFDDYRVGVTSSNPLGAIPMSRPVNVTAQFQSLGFGSPFRPGVKQEDSPPPISLPGVNVKKEIKKEVTAFDIIPDDSDPIFQFTLEHACDEIESDNVKCEDEMNSWEFDIPGFDEEEETETPILPDLPSLASNDDNKITIGSYTKAERRRKISRYREKKANRSFTKKIMYKCRKQFADNRPRVGGRFVPMKNKAKKEPKETKKYTERVT